MTNQRQEPEIYEPEIVKWGDVPFWANRVLDTSTPQTAQRIAQGVEGSRADIVGVVPVKFADFSGGLVRASAPRRWDRDLNMVYYNQGIQTHVPGVACLGWLVTTQATLTAVDHSGFRAANKRAHGAMFNNRFYTFLGTQLLKDTSTSDHALTVPATADNVTELVTAAAVITANSTRYLTYAGSTTDDIQGTTDPSADTVSMTKIVTLTGTPYINAIVSMPHLGPGVNIIFGQITDAGGPGVWFFKESASLPASVSPVVLSDTKDQSNTTNVTETTGATSPHSAYAVGLSGTSAVAAEDWVNPTNILLSDDAYATINTGGAFTLSDLLIALFDFRSLVPPTCDILGVTATIERKENDAAVNAVDEIVALVNGLQTTTAVSTPPSFEGALTYLTANKAISTEWPTTEASATYGSSTDLWGATGLDAATIRDPGLGLALAIDITDSGSPDASVDHMTLNIAFRRKGTMPKPVLGGYGFALPNNPSRVVCVEPVSADTTGVTVRRRLVIYDFEWDATGERPVVTVSYPNTGLSYVEDICPFQDGVLVAGDTSAGLGKQVKHVDSRGDVRNYNFPGFHGSAAVGVVSMFDLGGVALVDVAKEDGTESQWWVLEEGRWHPSWPLQSKSNAISSLPIAWAERTLGTFQNRIYRFFPVSTTNLAAARSFVPRNIKDDPMVTNTSEKKHDGPLYLITPEFEIGPTESENNINLIRHLGRQISAVGGTYGTVTYDVEVSTDSADIDNTFAAPDITTGALDERFEEYKVPSSGKLGRTFQFRMTLDNDGSGGAGSTKTPNGLPWYVELSTKRPSLSEWKVFVNATKLWQTGAHWGDLVSRLKTESAEKPVQQFVWSTIDAPAELVGWGGTFAVVKKGSVTRTVSPRTEEPYLIFSEKRGQTSA